MQGATEFSSMAKESDENSMPVSALPEEEEAETKNSKGGFFTPVVVDEEEKMLQYARGLSFEQRIVFDKAVRFCKLVKRSKKDPTILINPPQLIVTGNNIDCICLLNYFNTLYA